MEDDEYDSEEEEEEIYDDAEVYSDSVDSEALYSDSTDSETSDADWHQKAHEIDSQFKWHPSVIHAIQIEPRGPHSFKSRDDVPWVSCRTIVQFQIPPEQWQHNLLYFEITLTQVPGGIKPVCGIGLSPLGYHNAMTGWYSHSLGYHSDDGLVFNNRGWEDRSNYIAPFTKGDTAGLLWDLCEGHVTFTLNGVEKKTTGDLKFTRSYKKRFYPCVTTDRGIAFDVNFGEDPKRPFVWNGFRQFYLAFASFRNNLKRLASGRKYDDIDIIAIRCNFI
jgi:hypothetical protein